LLDSFDSVCANSIAYVSVYWNAPNPSLPVFDCPFGYANFHASVSYLATLSAIAMEAYWAHRGIGAAILDLYPPWLAHYAIATYCAVLFMRTTLPLFVGFSVFRMYSFGILC